MAHVTIDHSSAAWVVNGPVIKVSIFCGFVGWMSLSYQPGVKPIGPQLQHVPLSQRTVFIFCRFKIRFFKNEWPFRCLSLCLCLKLPWAACWSLPYHLLVPRWPAAVRPATSAAGSAVRPQAWKMASSLDGETWTHLCWHSVKPSE